jgi:hypothetical protein
MNDDFVIVHVVEARYLGGYRVWLRFDDGLEGRSTSRSTWAAASSNP